MTSSENKWSESPTDIIHVEIGIQDFTLHLRDGRKITSPMWWYPQLYAATVKQRQEWEILPFMDAVAWFEIDEFIGVKGVLKGGPCKGAVPPVMDAAE